MYKATEPGTLLALFSNPGKPYDLGDAGLIIKCHGATAWCRPCYAPCQHGGQETCSIVKRRQVRAVTRSHIMTGYSRTQPAPRLRAPHLRIERRAAMARTGSGGAGGTLGA